MEQKPAAQVSVTAVQKRPVPAPHQAVAAGVVPSVAKAGAPPRTPRALPPRKAAYVVVVGAFESATTAEEVKHLVQSKGYVVHVVLQGTVSKVMTAPMRTRAQAESVARGLEAVGLHPQLLVW
jgi:cell division septation protein DedD